MIRVFVFFVFIISSYVYGDNSKLKNVKPEVVILTDRNYELNVDQVPAFVLLKDYFNFKPVIVSSSREWQLLSKRDNICLIDRIKTPERESLGIFSSYPNYLNTPYHILTSNAFSQSKPIDLLSITNKHPNFKIGIVKGYYYGNELDTILKQLPAKNKFVLSGSYSTQDRLIKMLQLGRIDGLLIYNYEIDGILNEANKKQFKLNKINGASEVIYSYLVCSKSTLGINVVSTFNKLLKQQKYRTLYLQMLQKMSEFGPKRTQIMNEKYKESD